MSNDVATLTFDALQAERLEVAAIDIAGIGGPQASGARDRANQAAQQIAGTLTGEQRNLVSHYAAGRMSLLIVNGMMDGTDGDIPEALPDLSVLQSELHCLRLASRSQILLSLVEHRAFALDLDNCELVRLVGNFKGGGKVKLEVEKGDAPVERSSHSGVALGAHTEPPYYCSIKSLGSHSPSPSTLILTARWNPKSEPTSIIPMNSVIERIGAHNALALTAKEFNFARTESFAAGKGEDGAGVSILDIDDDGTFVVRYNAYRFSASDAAPASAKQAFETLKEEVSRAEVVRVGLQPDTAILINNSKALHSRDEVEDNRRLLIRMFGYSRDAREIVLSDDPLLVQG